MTSTNITAYYLGDNQQPPLATKTMQIDTNIPSSVPGGIVKPDQTGMVKFELTGEQKREISMMQTGFPLYLSPVAGNHLESGMSFNNYDELKTWTQYTIAYTNQLKTLKDTSWLNSYFVVDEHSKYQAELNQMIMNGTAQDKNEYRQEQLDNYLKASAGAPADQTIDPKLRIENVSLDYEISQLSRKIFGYDKSPVATVNLNGIEGRIILDLDDSNTLNNASEVLKTKDLIAFDSNRDGLVDKNDDYFHKLKVVTGDSAKGYTFTPLASLMSHLAIEEYAKASAHLSYEGDPFTKEETLMRYIDPVYTHIQYKSDELEKFFKPQDVTEDGWVVRGEGNESFFESLAYERTTLDGKSYLQTSGSYDETRTTDELNLAQRKRFTELYVNYKKEKAAVVESNNSLAQSLKETDIGVNPDVVAQFSTPYLKTLEKEFERLTGMSFSENNLEQVNRRVKNGEGVNVLRDMDTITGIKQNDDGTYLLKFDTGRTVKVKDLYHDTGTFVGRGTEYRSNLMLQSDLSELSANSTVLSQEELSSFAIWQDDRLTTLKDAGVEQALIQRFDDEKRLEVLLNFGDGSKTKAEGLYAVEALKDTYRFQNLMELNAIVKHPYADSGNPDNARTMAKV